MPVQVDMTIHYQMVVGVKSCVVFYLLGQVSQTINLLSTFSSFELLECWTFTRLAQSFAGINKVPSSGPGT
jgi:hypothetical protein